jgi:hypothetical protein
MLPLFRPFVILALLMGPATGQLAPTQCIKEKAIRQTTDPVYSVQIGRYVGLDARKIVLALTGKMIEQIDEILFLQDPSDAEVAILSFGRDGCFLGGGGELTLEKVREAIQRARQMRDV